MDIVLNLTKIKLMDQMIHLQATGTPEEFASKLGVSRATLYNYLKTLKSLGIPIEYNTRKRCYFYKKKGRMDFRFYEQKKIKKHYSD